MSFTLTKQGLIEIEASEGFSSRPYLDTIAKPARWTIGFGETNGITASTKAITRKEGEQQLIRRFAHDYAFALKPFESIKGFNQNMYDALASFIWNCGTGAVGSDTKVGKALRAGAWKLAAVHMMSWCKAGGRIIEGLQNRRRRETKMLLTAVVFSVTRKVLTRKESEWTTALETERKIAKRNGGWTKVDPSHLKNAAIAKRQILDRISQIKKQEDQGKAYRAERLVLLSDIVAHV